MNPNQPPNRRSPFAWATFIFSVASLCFSLWVTVYKTGSGGFFARYGLLSLGMAITAGTGASLLPFNSFHRKWLMAIQLAALIISFAGIYQMSR
jgi:hypothetical protein